MRLKPSESSEPSASSPRAWCTLSILLRVHNLISSLLISLGEHAHISRAVLGFFQDQEARCIIRPLVRPHSSDTNFSWTPPSTFRLSSTFHRIHHPTVSSLSSPFLSQLRFSKHQRRPRRCVAGIVTACSVQSVHLTLCRQFTAQHWSYFMSNALFGSSRIVNIAAAYANQVIVSTKTAPTIALVAALRRLTHTFSHSFVQFRPPWTACVRFLTRIPWMEWRARTRGARFGLWWSIVYITLQMTFAQNQGSKPHQR